MDSSLKKKLRALSLALRHTLEGSPGQAGDLESRLNQIGVWKDRPPKPLEELRLSPQDVAARGIVDAFLNYRQEAGISQEEAFIEFVRESAYTWANRLFMLRCLESRALIDEVVLQKQVYGGRSLVHHRFAQQNPSACAGEDDGLFSVLEEEFRRRAAELPTVFDPQAPAIALRPSVSALKRCIRVLSGSLSLNGQGEATDELFEAGDAPGWAYQFWNAEEKGRVFEKIRTEKGAKIEGPDLIPATQLYTEPYMVKFLVQNSLGALWAGMYPETKLPDRWEYYVRDADRTPPVHPDPPPFDPTKAPEPSTDPWTRPNPKLSTEADILAYGRTLQAKVAEPEAGGFVDLRNQLLDAASKPVLAKLTSLHQEICKAWDREWPARRPKLKKRAAELTFLDPACGSGHFLLEAFDLLYKMYEEESILRTAEDICASILNHNLFGIDIDERAVQISVAALWMHALEHTPNLKPEAVTGLGEHIIAANFALPRGRAHLEEFLAKHPEDSELRPALEAVFRGLADANQLGTLLRIEAPVEQELQRRKEEEDRRAETTLRQSQSRMDFMSEQFVLAVSQARDYEAWKRDVLARLQHHFRQEATVSDPVQAFFGRDAGQGLALFDLLARRYDIVSANPPYMGSRNMGKSLKKFCLAHYAAGKRDLYSAFMLRCASLARPDGYVAMVTQQSWMFLRSFATLRAFTSKHGSSGGGDLLRTTSFELFAHLGSNAFPEISGEVVNTVLFCLRNLPPRSKQLSTTIRLVNAPTAVDKDRLLKSPSARTQFVFSRRQSDFLLIQYSPIVYWLSDALLELICKSRSIKDLSFVRQGICTTNNPRFTRYFWELPFADPGPRWFPFEKGGGALRWVGFHQSIVDWQLNGTRVKSYQDDTPGAIHWSGRMPDEKFLFRPGWTFSRISGGTLAARIMPRSSLFCNTSPAAIPYNDSDLPLVGFWLNTRLLTFLLRSLTQRLDCQEGYVQRLPLPLGISPEFANAMISPALALRQRIIESVFTEPCFRGEQLTYVELTSLQSLYLLNEAAREAQAFEAARLSTADVAAVLAEVGEPAGCLPVIDGYDTLPDVSAASLSQATLEFFGSLPRVSLSDQETQSLRERLRVVYEASLDEAYEVELEDSVEETPNETDDDDDEEEPQVVESRAVTPENRLEALSTAFQINPISLHWLILEGVERHGWKRGEESTEATLDSMSIGVLRLFGYRWPGEGSIWCHLPYEPTNSDGIILITDGPNKAPLGRRIAGFLTEAWGSPAASRFELVVGMSLTRYVEREFYARHVRQFRGRPIIWQVQTQPSDRGGTPVLSCLIYSHRAAGALPNLRTQYGGTLRNSFESELRALESLTELSTDQSARKGKLSFWIDELKQFQETLEGIEARGFFTRQLRHYAIVDAIHSLARRWLGRLRDGLRKEPLAAWQKKAEKQDLHPDFPSWIAKAVEHVDRQCVAVAPDSPSPDTPDEKLSATALAESFRGQAPSMIRTALEALCREWQSQFDKGVVQPLREQIKAAEEEYKQLDDNIQNKLLRKDLKSKVKVLKSEIAALLGKSGAIADEICDWRCPEAEKWVEWLATQPLYDEFTSLDGRRPVPKTVADFVSQESLYAPDINDGVRVNIAPLQKAGILARNVLAAKDVDKAIADRAEWRADERRWCRQGVLPRPGWWPEPTISATDVPDAVSSTAGI